MPPDQVTQTVRAGLECDDATGAVVPPIHLTSTFAFRGFGDKRRYDYTRSGNPTRDLLGEAIAELELGVGAVVTATGMAAITLVGYLIPGGARIVAPHDCYGGTYRLFDAWRRRGERECEFVDFGDLAAVKRRSRQTDGAAVDRDAEQSAAAHHRYRAVRRARTRGRRAGRGRQHVPLARMAAAAALWARISSCTRRRST